MAKTMSTATTENQDLPPSHRLAAFGRRFWRCRRGATAVEFALVAVPFLMLVLANVETALISFTNSVVQGGIMSAARLVRTGQVTSSTTGSCPNGGAAATIPAAFSTAVCNDLIGLLSCSNLTYDVRSYATFAAANTTWTPTYDNNGNPTNNCFDTGGSSGIVAIRVVYTYTYVAPGLGSYLQWGNSGGATSQAFLYTVILQNEPF